MNDLFMKCFGKIWDEYDWPQDNLFIYYNALLILCKINKEYHKIYDQNTNSFPLNTNLILKASLIII